jgi:hypothetical protein
MQSVSTRIDSFSTFKVSLPELDSVAIATNSFPQNGWFENGPTVQDTLVTCLKFARCCRVSLPFGLLSGCEKAPLVADCRRKR